MIKKTAIVFFTSIILSLALFPGFDADDTFPPMSSTEIYTIDDLYVIRYNLSGNYILMNNLDFQNDSHYVNATASKTGNTTGSGWLPIGTDSNRFTGTFDGNNHTISNLYINRSGTEDIGLFGYVRGTDSNNRVTISNIGLINVNITGANYVGGLTGRHWYSDTYNSYSTGVINGGVYSFAGGLIGYNREASIKNSYTTANVTAKWDVGGLVGLQSTNGVINNSYSTGYVTGEDDVGGLVGRNSGVVLNSFYDNETSGQSDTGNGTGKNTSDMQTITTFSNAGWDIALYDDWAGETWYIENPSDYPRLGWEYESMSDVTTVATLHATNIKSSSAVIWGNLSDDGNETCLVGFEWGTNTSYGNSVITSPGGLLEKIDEVAFPVTANAMVNDSTYLYAGGWASPYYFYQYWMDNLTFKARSVTGYGGIIYGIAVDDVYVYVGGDGAKRVRQYWKSNLTYKAQAETYGYIIYTLAVDDDYVYAGDYNKVLQFWKSNLTLKASVSYGGQIQRVIVDDDYVYAGGWTSFRVRQYWKSNMTMKAESASYGNTIYALAQDDDYVYAGGASTIRVRQYRKSDMAYIRQSATLGGTIRSIVVDDIYVHSCGHTQRITQLWKTNLSTRATSEATGNELHTITDDESYVYVQPWETYLIKRYSKDYFNVSSPYTISYTLLGLDPGITYHYRAWAKNSNGTAYGEDMNFTTIFPFAGGTGNESNPYQIHNWSALDNVRYFTDKHYILINNISSSTEEYHTYASSSANGGAGWLPIGDTTKSFTGTFNGQNYTISDLYINRASTSNLGLFGYVYGCTIINLGVVDVDIQGAGSNSVGGLVGRGTNSVLLDNVYTTGSVSAGYNVGGIVGAYFYSSIIDNSYSSCTVSSSTTGGEYATGGVIGFTRYSCIFRKSYATGNVKGRQNVGGFAGYDRSSGFFYNCYATGDVDTFGGTVSSYGGFIGKTSYTTIDSCFATGNVRGMFVIGGFVGYFSTSTTGITNCYSTGTVTRVGGSHSQIAGFVGEHYYSPIKNCYSLGSVHYTTATDPTDRGFAGLNNTGMYYADIGNFFDNETSLQSSTWGNAIGHNTNTMYSFDIFNDRGWDIVKIEDHDGKKETAIWFIDDGNDYPRLWFELTSEISFLNETPANNSVDVTGLLTNWSIYVRNIKIGNSSGTIECSNGDSTSWTDEGAGRKTLTFTEWLDYNTTYYVWVNATAEDITINETFNFKTEKCTISGTITEEFWGAVPDVKIVADGPEQFITYTDNNGFYEIDVGTNYGSGVEYNVTASKFAYTFSPEYRLEDLERKVTNANFTGIHFFFKGTGTPDDPFTIRNCTHLNNVRLFYNYSFVLHGDIDMSECNIKEWNDGKGFEPICNETTPFNGTFDGGAHVISNLYSNYSDMDYMGLFGYVKNSDIQNLGLKQVNITGGNYTGSLAGYIDNTSILMCFAYSNNSIVGNNYAGGLVGVFENSSIQNSYARVNTTGITIGGMFGRTINSTVNLTYATGDVTGGGGLIGSQSGSTITNSYFDNQTSGTTTSEGGIGKNTTDMTSLDFWGTTEFSFPDIWFLDENQNDKYPILSIFTEITPPLLREVNRAGSLTQQIYRYLNSSYSPEDYCFFNLTAFVPQERYTGRWNKNVSDRYFIATGIEEEDWSDTKNNYVLASRVIATYTGYYDQMRVFTVWHGHYPSTLGCAIYSDKNGEPGDILGYTDAWNFPADRDSIWFPDYSHVWLTLDLYTPVLLAKDTAYWLLVTTNDSSMWRESYSMPGMNLSGMSDFIWTLGTTVGEESNVKMLSHNVTLNIPNKEYVDLGGGYGYWRGDVWNSTFSWDASFEGAGWEQGKDSITSTNLSQLLIYTLCSVDVSHVDITNVTMTWGTGYEENIVWDEPVEMSRISPDMNYWEYNKTDIAGGDWNTWKATLYDEFGNVESYDYYRWMNHGVTERIYFQCNVTTPPEGVKLLNSTTNLYSNDWVFYLYEAYYDDTPDVYGDNEGRKQALRHEQGVDGSAYDTGYWTTETPTDEYHERTCAFFVGGLWDQDVVIPDNITIENAFVSWWMGSGRQLVVNSTGAAQNIHWGRADIEASFDEFYIKDYGYGEWRAVTYDGLEDTIAWQDMPLTRRPSNDWINFNESTWYDPPFFDNSTGRITDRVVRQVVQKLDFSSLSGTDYPNTFDSNSIYQLFMGMDYDAMWSSGANAILTSNRSHPSFVIFNIPGDETLKATDSNNDGITDYESLYIYGLHPFWNDTDNDGFTDIQELSRDTKANLYRDYPDDSNIILIKDMKPFKGNNTDEWAVTLSVTVENPNEQDMDVNWYILKNFTFNSSYINQNQLLEGEWELIQTNSSVSDGTYTMTYAPASGDNHWAVYASDGTWWGNRSSVFEGPGRQINGTILKDGYGFEGVTVTAVANDTGITYYDYTDSDGYYLITNISGGNYVITPTSEGHYFIPYDKSVSLTYENLTVDFESVDILYSAESPYNNSWDANNSLVWSILIEHKYEFDWSIECSDGNSSSDTTDTTGRKNLTLSGLEYDTWYTVWVNSSNSEYPHVINNGTYRFKVREEKIDYPGQPLDFTATTYNYTRIDLSWSKGVNATNTYIRYAFGSVPPANRSSGIFLYNNTGTSLNVEDLEQGTEYSFSAWSWNETYNSWSHRVIDNATTDEEPQEPNYLNISIVPGSIDFGNVDMGNYKKTDSYYFNLTNHGMNCYVEISIQNSQNLTFVNFTEKRHDKFSMNFSKNNWTSEENIKTDNSTKLAENIIWKNSILFDIKLLMPTSMSKLSDGESIIITFTATPT